jgi:hypothetical protein
VGERELRCLEVEVGGSCGSSKRGNQKKNVVEFL